jgi:hypothetical protein
VDGIRFRAAVADGMDNANDENDREVVEVEIINRSRLKLV